MNKDLKQFLDWLKENDRSEEEKMQCKLLDEYMKTRDNLPGKGVTGSDWSLTRNHLSRLLMSLVRCIIWTSVSSPSTCFCTSSAQPPSRTVR